MIFVDYVRENQKTNRHGSLEHSIETAIDRCIKENVLKEFLIKRRTEVVKVMRLDYTFDRQITLECEESRAEGHAEGHTEGLYTARISDILELLGELGTVPENISARVASEQSMEKLKSWLKLAAHADSIESFESRM